MATHTFIVELECPYCGGKSLDIVIKKEIRGLIVDGNVNSASVGENPRDTAVLCNKCHKIFSAVDEPLLVLALEKIVSRNLSENKEA